MFEIKKKIEDLALEAEQLASLSLVISQAMSDPCRALNNFSAGIDLFSDLLFEHHQKMSELLEQVYNCNQSE